MFNPPGETVGGLVDLGDQQPRRLVLSVAARLNLKKVIAKLGLYRPMDHTQFIIKNHLIEFWHHLPLAERSQIATITPRWAA